MRFYEYRLSPVIYGKQKPDLCYSRASNRYTLYDDTMQPRVEIACVFWGDKGWTFTGIVQAGILDEFANHKQAMFAAFSRYTQQRTKQA